MSADKTKRCRHPEGARHWGSVCFRGWVIEQCGVCLSVRLRLGTIYVNKCGTPAGNWVRPE